MRTYVYDDVYDEDIPFLVSNVSRKTLSVDPICQRSPPMFSPFLGSIVTLLNWILMNYALAVTIAIILIIKI